MIIQSECLHFTNEIWICRTRTCLISSSPLMKQQFIKETPYTYYMHALINSEN